MKILHINDYFAPIGGVETYLLELINILEGHGCQNTIIYQKQHPRTQAIKNGSTYYVPSDITTYQMKAEVSSILDKQEPDIVYLHDFHNPKIIKWVAKTLPTIGYVHIFFPVCPGLGKLFRRRDKICGQRFGIKCIPNIYLQDCASARNPVKVFRIMHATKEYLDAYKSLKTVIVASKYMKNLLMLNGISEKLIEVLPYFISTNERAQLTGNQIVPENPYVFFAGRIEYEKGLNYLIEAVLKLDRNINLYIAGSGSLESYYKNYVQELNATDRIHFLGWLSEDALAKYYQNCVVTVMPTLMPEPFGKVGVEAMVNGRPVIAFEVGGIPDWLIDGYNGFLVPPCDVDKLTSKIRYIFDNPEVAEELGENGRKYVEMNYSVSKHIKDLQLVLGNAVSS